MGWSCGFWLLTERLSYWGLLLFFPSDRHPRRACPERSRTTDLTYFLILAFIFRIFSPKIACQAPKPPKPLKSKEIELEFS
jgi:hypothetical protein